MWEQNRIARGWAVSLKSSNESVASSRVCAGVLARGLSWTLNRRIFSHTDRILLQHISFLASGPNLNKSFSQLFTQNFFWLFPPSFSKNGKKSENFSLESRDLNSANPQVAIFNSAADYSVRFSDRELWALSSNPRIWETRTSIQGLRHLSRIGSEVML